MTELPEPSPIDPSELDAWLTPRASDEPSEPGEASEADVFGFPVESDERGGRDTLEVVASEFAARVRRGERPSVALYAQRHPEIADALRSLLPMVASLEEWKVQREADVLRHALPEEFTPQRLGPYAIRRELGRGGMGIVYEAVEDGSGHRVALKLLPWRFAAAFPRWGERFRREAVTIGRLRHRNIVPVYRFDEADGYYYYSMQLVAGVDLRWVIARLRQEGAVVYAEELRRRGEGIESGRQGAEDPSPFRSGRRLARDSWTGFAKIAVQAAQALAYAHKQGVTHNDVKPGNLLLDSEGHVFVTDFGVAPTGEGPYGDERLTATLRYMAPERLEGHCDARSDVYSLGVTLYELTTRRCACDATAGPDLIEQRLHAEPPPPRQLVPEMPRPLEAVILQAIARNPDERYASADALLADLLRFLAGESVQAPLRRRHWFGWFRTLLGRSQR
jgi:serine/threonine protein kinase